MPKPSAAPPAPPFSSCLDARNDSGAAGEQRLLAWVLRHYSPPRSLLDAARAMEPNASPERAKTVARTIREAAKRNSVTLPTYPTGAPKGSAAHTRALARRGLLGGAVTATKIAAAQGAVKRGRRALVRAEEAAAVEAWQRVVPALAVARAALDAVEPLLRVPPRKSTARNSGKTSV